MVLRVAQVRAEAELMRRFFEWLDGQGGRQDGSAVLAQTLTSYCRATGSRRMLHHHLIYVHRMEFARAEFTRAWREWTETR